MNSLAIVAYYDTDLHGTLGSIIKTQYKTSEITVVVYIDDEFSQLQRAI